MQLNLTTQSLKLISQLAKEKRKKLLYFRDYFYGQKETRYRMDEKLCRLEVLIADILQAVKARKLKSKEVKSHLKS